MTRVKQKKEERREQRIRKICQDAQVYLVFDLGACNEHRGKIHSKVSKIDK
jgi:hypothetical protein